MNFGTINTIGGYYPASNYRQSQAARQTGNSAFLDALSAAKPSITSSVEDYTEYLKSRYGNVMVENVGKDQKSMDALGSRTAGTGNVVIASNILEEMANNPEKAAYYEGKIRNYFNSVPRYQADLAAFGHEIHSSGIVIHPDGTVTHYISGDLTPAKRKQIEAAMKAEDEAKAKRRAEYKRASEEHALKLREAAHEADVRYAEKMQAEKIQIGHAAMRAQFFGSDLLSDGLTTTIITSTAGHGTSSATQATM